MNVGYGNAQDLEETAEELRKIEQKLAGIYEMETNLTSDEALEVMKEDKFLEIDWLEEKGFVTNVKEFKAVATFKKQDKMADSFTKEQAEGMFAKFEKTIMNLIKGTPKNKVVQDANGEDVDFYELSEEDAIVVGSKARIGGEDAEGDVLMPSGETYKFEGGELVEIVAYEEEEEEDVEALKNENAQLKEEIEALKNDKTELENKIAEQESAITAVREDFKNLKKEISSNFDADGKIKKPDAPKSRSLKG